MLNKLLGPQCQSCGMPLKQDPKNGGTEADGSQSQEYCSYCYVDGKFMQPDMTAEEMQAFCKEKIIEQGTPAFMASFFVMQIPKLKRWQQ